LLVKPTPRNVNLGSGRFAMFNKERDISVLRCGMDSKVERQSQVVHAIEDQCLALNQAKASSLGYDRILGKKIQRGGMMLLADFP
jgi:hypothetical protein